MISAERKLQLIEGTAPADYFIHIGFATASQDRVDQHFGSSRTLMIYGVSAERASLFEVVQFKSAEPGHDTGKLTARFEALQGCSAVYCMACGPSVMSQLKAMNVQVLTLESGTSIHDLLVDLQQQIRSGASGWLGKAVRQAQSLDGEAGRLSAMLDEDW